MGGGLHRLPLMLLLYVPWHLRLTAQPLLLCLRVPQTMKVSLSASERQSG